MENSSRPYYKRIYLDMMTKKFPDKIEKYHTMFQKEELSALDVIKLNEDLFGKQERTEESESNSNQKYRSYLKSDILQILDYQRKNKLNNSEIARHFKLSRNTVKKWKDVFVH
ncbi:hypothetical protein SAMN05421786_109105 [Chryseobacterium ureilyticum]|uniref:Helix-turn-helix domain-containing protein n=1 Tax=Chryseobacterium ureilyticum TaxID=373668 RepID=A0A1N7QF24_9FLAO|nr:transposase [Chryseobacterium ureilyticum]SIT21406.1 hypothetical protein SAMN05421786_109105 [Chryseobacterium ureilyticum]